jgi:hypothetical protein
MSPNRTKHQGLPWRVAVIHRAPIVTPERCQVTTPQPLLLTIRRVPHMCRQARLWVVSSNNSAISA